MTPRKTSKPPPARAPSAKRSAQKSAPAHKAGRPWPPAVKRDALKRLRAGATVADVHRATGVTKPTLSSWARTAGIDVSSSQTRHATEAKVAELALDAVSRLERIRDYELTALESMAYLEAIAATELEVAERVREVSTMGGPIYLPARGSTAEHAGQRLEALKRIVGKRDLVGAAGLLVDKLEVLAGRATANADIVVRFGIPRPDFARADADAVDLPPAD